MTESHKIEPSEAGGAGKPASTLYLAVGLAALGLSWVLRAKRKNGGPLGRLIPSLLTLGAFKLMQHRESP